MNKENTTYNLLDYLAKTSYFIKISEKTKHEKPIAYGTGFFVNYKNNCFFLTADHNIHLNDHDLNVRTGLDNNVEIFNNLSNKEKFETLVTPISGFYYMESIDITKPNQNPELFDVALSLVDKSNLTSPFLTDDNIISETGEQITKPGENKIQFLEEQLVVPNTNDIYFIFGKIKPNLNGLFLHRKFSLKENIKYIEPFGDYLLFNTESIITDYEDWAGLSGSPVVNQIGGCVGVLCSINVNTKSLWIKPFSKIKPLMDLAILQINDFKK